jgi:penicillin amidase
MSDGEAPRPRRRRLRRILLALAGVLALVPLGGAGLVGWTLPGEGQVRAGLAAAGLAAPVRITYDGAGVPLIRADSERDAWIAMGWLHARDRMFQMDAMRRGAAGRLSEWAGEGMLRSDRFVRLLGLARRAEEDLAALPEEVRDMLEAYAAGVNAWIAERGRPGVPAARPAGAMDAAGQPALGQADGPLAVRELAGGAEPRPAPGGRPAGRAAARPLA